LVQGSASNGHRVSAVNADLERFSAFEACEYDMVIADGCEMVFWATRKGELQTAHVRDWTERDFAVGMVLLHQEELHRIVCLAISGRFSWLLDQDRDVRKPGPRTDGAERRTRVGVLRHQTV
jgi:hypothetical protein